MDKPPVRESSLGTNASFIVPVTAGRPRRTAPGSVVDLHLDRGDAAALGPCHPGDGDRLAGTAVNGAGRSIRAAVVVDGVDGVDGDG